MSDTKTPGESVVFFSSEFKSAPEALFHRLNCIDGIKILCKLTRCVQKHRGATIACINKDTSFLPLAEELEQQTDKLFLLLTHQQNQQHILPQEKIILAVSDWRAIKIGWQKDTVIQNYEFHCHLVDVLGRMMRNCLKDCLLENKVELDTDSPLTNDIRAVLITVPENIELLAKLRGLATHVAVSGNCDHDSRIRISFLQERISRDHKRLYHSLSKLQGPLANLQSMQSLPHQKTRLDTLLDLISSGILEAAEVNVDSGRVFQLATEIIDIYWLIVAQGLQALEDAQFAEYLRTE